MPILAAKMLISKTHKTADKQNRHLLLQGLSEILCRNYLQTVRNCSNLRKTMELLMFFVSLNFVEWKFQFFTLLRP